MGLLWGGGIGGGGGLTLGPATNSFNGADRAAAEAARDAYAVANPLWLAQYGDDESLLIVLSWPVTASSGTYQVREHSQWLDISGLTLRIAGGIAAGGDARNELRWNTTQAAWEPVSTVQTLYGLATRGSTFADAKAAMDAVANESGGVGASAAGLVRIPATRFVTSWRDSENPTGTYAIDLDTIWPGRSARSVCVGAIARVLRMAGLLHIPIVWRKRREH